LRCASATYSGRPRHSFLFISFTARAASSAVLKLTNAKPRDTPSGPRTMAVDVTEPNSEKCVEISFSSTSSSKFLM
jgi:hypothetical protein